MLAALLAGRAPGAAKTPSPFPAERAFRTVELGPGILAFVSPETSGPIPSGNVLAVLGDDGVLVFDSGRFPTLARRMIAEIRARTSQPVRYLVHSHWHLDHIVGDGEVRAAFPGLRLVTTDFTRRKILEKQVDALRDVAKNDAGYLEQIEWALARGVRGDGSSIPEEARAYLRSEGADIRLEVAELSGTTALEPDVTFDRTLTVHLCKREVRIAFVGEGNTGGDTVVSVPDAGVVATGDLLVAPAPYGYGCHPRAWIETLKKLLTTGATAIVPGHGPVQHDWDYAKKVIAVLEAVRAQLGEAVRAGATLEETQKRVDLAPFERVFGGEDYGRRRAFRDSFVLSAVERAYQEAKGKLAEE